jgi:hypothetical protein
MHLRTRRFLLAAAPPLAAVALAGCVRREIEITSTPPGAMVSLNGREIGRTPTTVEFTFDGTYDVRLRLQGYDPVQGTGTTKAPVWDFIGADLVAEIYPAELHRVDRWHFDLIPEEQAEQGLMDRAAAARDAATKMPPAVADAPAPRPTATPEGARKAAR